MFLLEKLLSFLWWSLETEESEERAPALSLQLEDFITDSLIFMVLIFHVILRKKKKNYKTKGTYSDKKQKQKQKTTIQNFLVKFPFSTKAKEPLLYIYKAT